MDLFERRTVNRFEDGCFEKPKDAYSFIVGEISQDRPPHTVYCGAPIRLVIQGLVPVGGPPPKDEPCRVVAPMSDWGPQTIEETLTHLVKTAAPFLSGQIRNHLNTSLHLTREWGDADRGLRVTPHKGPPVTLLSRGPAGYLLVDAQNPHRMGAVLFGHRIRVLQRG
jgi:hypothetical protein